MTAFLQWLVLGLAFLLGGSVARAAEVSSSLQYSKPAVRREIARVIEGQLMAFRARDFAEAHRLAAAPLRARLTPRTFAMMIARGYPLMLHQQRAELGLPMDDGSRAMISARLSAGGESMLYRYTLVKEADGWRVAGVIPEQSRASDI